MNQNIILVIFFNSCFAERKSMTFFLGFFPACSLPYCFENAARLSDYKHKCPFSRTTQLVNSKLILSASEAYLLDKYFSADLGSRGGTSILQVAF